MRARDLAQAVDVADPSDDTGTAMRRLGASGLPGLVVRTGKSFVVVPGSQVLRVALPQYVLDDPALGRVWDEASADKLAERLAGLCVSDLLAALDTDDDAPGAIVDGDATAVEVAAVMAVAHLPLVVVVEDGALVGVVTASRLIAHLSR